MLYKAVVQLVLLYGSKSCVLMGLMIKVLEVFHHRLVRSITGMTLRCTTSGEWEWTLVSEVLETAWLWSIMEYVQQRQVTVAAQVACRTIYEICTEAERMLGTSRCVQWLGQDVGREV